MLDWDNDFKNEGGIDGSSSRNDRMTMLLDLYFLRFCQTVCLITNIRVRIDGRKRLNSADDSEKQEYKEKEQNGIDLQIKREGFPERKREFRS